MMYYSDNGATVYHGDCLDVLAKLPENSIDTVITDPPYELAFMGKAWDSSGVAFKSATWAAVLRVAKPGAMLLAFGGTRTFHRLTCAIEDAGWEIRDCMSWLYGSGFPKSLDISKAIDKAAGAEREVVGVSENSRPAHKVGARGFDSALGGATLNGILLTAPATDAARQWNGWGTALKPAWEPIVVAMKPLDGTFAENAQAWGVAGLNIDGGRIACDPWTRSTPYKDDIRGGKLHAAKDEKTYEVGPQNGDASGRWPANVLLDEAAAGMLDEQSGERPSRASERDARPTQAKGNCYGWKDYTSLHRSGEHYGDSGGASRFFYTAKASRSDRGHGNDHPTVKPTDLLKYLCKLTATPTGGVVLDPFVGSGTTMVAARETGRPCIGIDIEAGHCAITVDRLRQGVLFMEGGAA